MTVPLSNQNICLKALVKKYLQFYAENFCLSKPVVVNGRKSVKTVWLFFCLDSLSPINNLSVIKGQVFLG